MLSIEECDTQIEAIQAHKAGLLSQIAVFADEIEASKCITYKSINEKVSFLQGFRCNKNIGPLNKVNGVKQNNSHRVLFACSSQGCKFRVLCTRSKTKRFVDHFKVVVDESEIGHGGIIDDIPFYCTSTWIASARQVANDPIYIAQIGGAFGPKRAGVKSISVMQATIAISNKSAVPTVNIIKKANMLVKITEREHLDSYKLLIPYCEIAEGLNPDFKFDVLKDNNGALKRLVVLFPYSVAALENCFDVVGIDSAHMATVKLGRMTSDDLLLEYNIHVGTSESYTGLMLEAMRLTLLTGRTLNNELVIFAYMLGFGENSEDTSHFLSFLINKGMSLNRPAMTVLSDRSAAYISTIASVLPLALHHYCPLHIERNLTGVVKCSPAEIGQYWKIQRSVSISSYTDAMKVLESMPHGPQAVAYLTAIVGVWQLYKVVEKGNIVYEMKSDNLVEGAFAWVHDIRQSGSAYFVCENMFRKILERMNALKGAAADISGGEFLTVSAKKRFLENTQSSLGVSYTVSYSNIDKVALVGVVTTYVGLPPRKVDYNVDFVKKTCDCQHWQQSGVPCYHALTLLRKYPANKGGPLNAATSLFYEWCSNARLQEMFRDQVLRIPNQCNVDALACSDLIRYALHPRICYDPNSSYSTRRLASVGDKASGGGVSRAQASRLKRQRCPDCYEVRSRSTQHSIIACLKCQNRSAPATQANEYDPYLLLNDTTVYSDTALLFEDIINFGEE